MGIRFFKEPELEKPIMVACWPGIGNVGLVAVDTLRRALDAEELGEIEPWDFFYPRKVIIKNGELKDLEFPSNKFYFKRTAKNDIIFFIAEEQPAWESRAYAEGTQAYHMANLVLDVALKLGCRRAFTSGAAVASTHHTLRPRVWAVPNTESLISELRGYDNTVLMSDIEGRGGEGNITGLNGLLLGVARKRGVEAICVMGEIPVYLQGFPILYPKASKAVLEVLTAALGINIDMGNITEFAERSEKEIDRLYCELPPEAREHLDKLKDIGLIRQSEAMKITEEDKRKILDEVDKFFKKISKDGEN